MATDTDHDILVRNTTITEEMSRQLGSALTQLARGNERFQVGDQRMERLEHRVTRLEEQQTEGFARLRTDLLRAVTESAEFKKDSIEAAVQPILSDLAPIKEFVRLIHKIVRNFVRVLGWAASAATAVGVAYLIYLVIPK